jgi:hypothetical protein
MGNKKGNTMKEIRVLETRGIGAYEFEIHCEGCKDINKNLQRCQLWQEDTYTVPAGLTPLDIIRSAGWEDHARDHGMTLEEYVDDLGTWRKLMKVHNCAKGLVK